MRTLTFTAVVFLAAGAFGCKKKSSSSTSESDSSSLPTTIATDALAVTSSSLRLMAAADDRPPAADTDSCFKAFQAVLDDQPKKDTYANGVLDHLHDELYRFNKVQTSDIELIFCRLVNVMGFNPDLSALPETLSKSDPLGHTVSVTVSEPTESFAKDLGYVAKAEFKNNDTVFMNLWWAGSEDASKGYVIQGTNPMETDGNSRLRYAQWDKTSDKQTIKMMGTQFASTFLKSAAGGDESKTGGDHAIYGRLEYNTGTNAITAQQIEIRAGNTTATASKFKCVRTYFTGTVGGTIDGFRPAKGTPEEVTETSTGGTGTTGDGLDGETGIKDSTETADHAGTAADGSDLASGTFDYSCADINGLGDTSEPFAGDTVDYGKSPTDIFKD